MSTLSRSILKLVELYAIALTGGIVAHLLGLPASWMIGPIFFVSIALFSGRKLEMPTWLRSAATAVVGLVLGSGFSPDTLSALSTWPWSMLLLAVAVVGIATVAYFIFRRIGGWDHSTALFAALPGALSYVIVIAEEAGANMTKVTVAQTLRVFLLIAVLPILLMPFSGDQVNNAVASQGASATRQTLDFIHIALMLIGLAILAPIFQKLKVPSGLLISGILISGSLYMTGVYSDPLPGWVTIPSYVTIGTMVAVRFGAISLSDLLKLSGVSFLSIFASVLVSGFFAFLCHEFLGLPLGQVVLAFAPGGLDTMVLLSFLLDLNPVYVTGHHLVRFVGLVIFAPIVTSILTSKQTSDGPR